MVQDDSLCCMLSIQIKERTVKRFRFSVRRRTFCILISTYLLEINDGHAKKIRTVARLLYRKANEYEGFVFCFLSP